MIVLSVLLRSFDPSGPCEALHTKKSKQVFIEVEPDYWMTLVRCTYVCMYESVFKDVTEFCGCRHVRTYAM